MMKTIVFCFAILALTCSVNNAPPDLCSLPLVTGPCKAHMEKWGFVPNNGTCEQFVYGGCKGNANRFDSKADCMKVCGGHDGC